MDACLEAGKDDATIKTCRDDPDVKKIRKIIRPDRKEKADNRDQRAKAVIDALADCKRAGSTGCEDEAKAKKTKLFPKKDAEDEETDESFESMKGKRKKERMRRAVQDCDAGKEATCAKAAKDDLKKDLDVDEKEIAMIKRQTAPMMAADEIAQCEDAINSADSTKIDSVDKDCEALGKDLFLAAGSSADAWEERWKDKVLKLAKARFAGKPTNVEVNTKQVDTLFEADAVAGKCDVEMVERARNDIGNAAKMGDKDGKGETVVKFKGVDSATKKCRVEFATKVSEGKHEDAAAAINKAKEVGKKTKTKASGSGGGRMLRNLEAHTEGSVSSSPTSEELAEGSEAESTDFSEGGVTAPAEDEETGGAVSGAVKNSWAGAHFAVAVAVAVYSAVTQW
jgi:hypothetical protein